MQRKARRSGFQGNDARLEGCNRADALAHGLGRIHRGPGAPAAVQEEFRIIPVESLAQIRRKTAPDRPEGSPAIPVRITPAQGVQRLGIGPDDIPDIGDALEAAFDLEGIGPGPGQILQAVDQVEILQRQQRLVPGQDTPVPVFQVIERPAGLDTGTPVGAPAGQVLRQVALAAVTDAKGPMDKDFQFGIDGLPDGADLLQREFPLQHQPPVAQAFRETGLFRRTDSALGGGMEDHPFRGQPGHGRILDDEGVHPGIGKFLQEPPGLRDFLLINQGIEGYVDPGAEPVRIGTQLPDVLHRIPRRLARPEGRAGDIYGIGTAVDGGPADFRRTGGGEEFEGTQLYFV